MCGRTITTVTLFNLEQVWRRWGLKALRVYCRSRLGLFLLFSWTSSICYLIIFTSGFVDLIDLSEYRPRRGLRHIGRVLMEWILRIFGLEFRFRDDFEFLHLSLLKSVSASLQWPWDFMKWFHISLEWYSFNSLIVISRHLNRRVIVVRR